MDADEAYCGGCRKHRSNAKRKGQTGMGRGAVDEVAVTSIKHPPSRYGVVQGTNKAPRQGLVTEHGDSAATVSEAVAHPGSRRLSGGVSV